MPLSMPTSPFPWLLGLAGIATMAMAGYQMRESARVEAKANLHVAQAREAIERTRQEHAELRETLNVILEEARSIAAQAEAMQQRQRREVILLPPNVPPAAPVQTAELKEQAWKNYFRPIKGCEVWRDDAHMVECQNQVIRAKREFEQRWSAGEISVPGA